MNAKDRAEKVEKIETLLEEHYFLEEHDVETTVTDLVADAMHFAGEHGLDPYKITRMANHHFEEEITGED